MTEIYDPNGFNPYEIHTPEEIDKEVKKWQEWKLSQSTRTHNPVPRGYRREVFGGAIVKKETKP